MHRTWFRPDYLSAAPKGEGFTVYHHLNGVRTTIGRIYETPTGWQAVGSRYVQIGRAPTLEKAIALFESRLTPSA